MNCKLPKISHRQLALLFVAVIFTLMLGCNSENYSAQESQPAKRIIEIRVDEDDRMWHCVIKGDQQLAFSAINTVSPTGVSLYFPRTTLDISEADLAGPPNEIIE